MQGMTGIATGSYTITTTPTELCFTVSSAREQLKMHNGEPWRSLKQYAGMEAGVGAGEECPLFAPSIPFRLQPAGEPHRLLTRL